MSTYPPHDVQQALDAGRDATHRRPAGLRIVAGGASHPVLRLWREGFAMAGHERPLRGMVDLYDGPKHLGRCLIVATAEEAGERHFEFKRAPRRGPAPPADFAREAEPPAGVLPRAEG
ncbi:MAG: hypothetical protein ACLFTP_01580 [Rhodosalinus sp.]|uniref:hypothetical protein n=1 Tax=Rhodosalinus sp. TaxID=2047741 RepID=UPI00397BA4AA